MDSQRPALSPGGPQGLASPPGVWRLEATAISRAEALPAPVGPSWRVWGPVRGRCVRHVSGRGRFELEARPGCLVQAVTQSDEEQMVGAATWLLGPQRSLPTIHTGSLAHLGPPTGMGQDLRIQNNYCKGNA